LKQELSKEDPDEISRRLKLNFKDLPISNLLKKGKLINFFVVSLFCSF